MFLTRSLKQKIAATCGAVFGFVLFYEVTMLDSKTTVEQEEEVQQTTAKPAPGLRLRFAATAYCKGATTASGTAVRTGIAAADPDLLPVGSVIQIESLSPRYNGIYTILDTGPAVQGRHIDVYMWSCNEALAFGAKKVQLNVLRLGWNPRASTPTVIRSILDQRERQMSAAPPAPPADAPVPPAGVAPPEEAATASANPAPAAAPAPAAPAVSAPAPPKLH
jgi:3D (Asp-Asp-Asp) domain-containing protein